MQYRIPLYLLLVLATTLGCDDGSDAPVVKNCRITEIFYDDPTVGGRYSYAFHYNNDGTLSSITATNVSIRYKYRRGKLKTIEQEAGGILNIFTYEYPTENLITWTSNRRTRVSKLYHTGDKVDSLIVFDTPFNNKPAKFQSQVRYNGHNVETIKSSGGCCFYTTEDIVTNVDEIEYDNGLNPALLWLKSVGAFDRPGHNELRFRFFQTSGP